MTEAGAGRSRIWFKRRRYGWGWEPATREGWIVLGVWLVAIVVGGLSIIAISGEDHPARTAVWWVAYVLLATAALIGVCAATGPWPRWRWGWKDADDPELDA